MNKNSIKNFYDENGYVVIDNVYSKGDLGHFRKALQNVIDYTLIKAKKEQGSLQKVDAKDSIDSGLLTLRNADPQYVALVQRTIVRTPEFFQLNVKPEVVEMIGAVLDVPADQPFYLSNNGVLFTAPSNIKDKSAANIELPWHNDVFHTIPRSRFTQIWAPLIHDATEEIGTLIVCPGSHKEGVGQQIFSTDQLFFYRYMIDPEAIKRYQPQSIEVKLGQLLIFDKALYHRSGSNTSKHVRCSLVGAFHDTATEAFTPLFVDYKYFGQTPEAYYYELFGDPAAKALIDEQSYQAK